MTKRKKRPRPERRPRKITVTARELRRRLRYCAEPALYMNRELSLLEFQRRVLEEARDPHNKLLERVKFISIVSSNLDEFFMVRVAALKQKIAAGRPDLSIDGKTATEQLEAVHASVNQLMSQIYDCFQNQLLPELLHNGIVIADYATLDERERAAVDRYYAETIFPVLTPLAFDPGRPFPHISNLSLNFAIVLHDPRRTDDAGQRHFARVKVPEALPQLVVVPVPPTRRKAGAAMYKFVWIEQVIAANLKSLFPGLEIVESHPFHVTRDAEVAIQELESDDLLESVEEAVWRRRFRRPVRLQTDASISDHILEILVENLEMKPEDVCRVPGALDLARLRQLPSLDRPELRDEAFRALGAAGSFGRRGRRHVHDDPRGRPAAASSLSVVPAGGGSAEQSGARSGRAGDQDDALPRGPEFAHRAGAARSHRERQTGGGAGGVESALRRREQHRVGAGAGTRGRACGVRAARPEGALQDRIDRAARA